MPTSTTLIPRRPRAQCRVLALAAVLALTVAACSSNDKPRTEPHTTSTVPASTGTTTPGSRATPRATAADAVKVLLTAEQQRKQSVSYRLLSPAGRQKYPDVSDWEERRTEVPPIVAFRIEDDTVGRDAEPGSSARVVTDVTHKPGLDPFIGLSAAHERQTWVARRQASGWLVDPEPDVAYELPPASGAATAAIGWAQAVQACDQAKATTLQAVKDLYGSSTNAAKLCHSKGRVTVGRVGPLRTGPSTADLLAQYSTDALAWGRVVPVTAPSGRFGLVMAPLGSTWKVVGLTD